MSAPIVRHIPLRYFHLLRDILNEDGIAPSQFMQAASFDETRFNARDGVISASQAEALIHAALRLSGRTDLGFEMGKRIKMNSHSVLGYGLISCTHIDEFMHMASRHYHLMNEAWTLRYRPCPGGGEALYTPNLGFAPQILEFFLELLASAHHNQMALLLGERLSGYDIYLSMKAPPHRQRYYQLGPARCHFDSTAMPGLRVVMGTDMLRFPLAMGNADVARDIDERCRTLGPRPPRGVEGWQAYVTMVLQQTEGEQITLDELARRVNFSARTIDRHLKQEGLGFRELTEKIRFERACTLLAAQHVTITEVAQQLGFSDTANFSRAFSRVMGLSPSAYRQSLAADGQH
ncbi:MAG: AraC family transcriptional regulator ligand-binding domain-containing protein [Pseudomonadota bacterium]